MRRVACQLAFSGVKHVAGWRYRSDVARVGVMVLQVPAATPGGEAARLRSRRTRAGGSGDMMWVKITAIRLRSIAEFRTVGALLRERVNARAPRT